MGNKVNPNLLRLTKKSVNAKSFWNINKSNQYKTFIYQDFVIRKYIMFIFENFLQVPVGNVEIQRDSNNNLKIIIPFCNVTSFMLRKNFSQKKIFKITKNESKINSISKESEKIRIKQHYINLIKELLEYKIKSFSKSNKVEVVLKNYYNKIIRYFFLSFWKQNRQLENRFKRYSFYKNFNIFISFALQQKSPDILARFCVKQLQNVPNGRHHLILNILQFSLPIYLSLVPNILGLKIQVSGNLQGSERKRKRIIQIGQIPLQTISSDVRYSFKPSLTKFGSVGVKVWMYVKEDFVSNDHLYSNVNKSLSSNISITDILTVISKFK